MDRPTESLAKIGSDPTLRAAQLSMLRQVEKAMARPDFDVREEVTGPIVDALHEGVGPLTKRLRGGIDFHFHYRSKIARDFVMSPDAEPDHVWEPQTTKLLVNLGHDKKHVVIGGAYSGDQAILLAHAMKKRGGTCHCFEPNRDQMAMLKRNAQSNRLDNVVFNQLGLWNTDNSHLVLVGDDSFAHPEAANGGDPDAFATTTIDSYGAQHGVDQLGLIMLDIEGAEFAALQGARGYLGMPAGKAPHVIFEVHRHYVDWSNGLGNTEIAKYLAGLGYSLFSVRDYQSNVPMADAPIELIRPQDTYLEGPPHGFNMLAVKDESVLQAPLFRFRSGVSPKLLMHRNPKLHQPGK